jgi:exodeoxyribonuclease VII large subunit
VLEGAMRRYIGDTRQKIERAAERAEQFTDRLRRCVNEMLSRCGERTDQLGKLLESYSFHSVLNRGFALVRDQDDQPVLTASETRAGDTLSIEFTDGRVGAKVTDGVGAAPRLPSAAPRRRGGGNGNQGTLL